MVSVTLVTRPSSPLSAVLKRCAGRLRLALNVISLNRLREMRLAPDFLILDLTSVSYRTEPPDCVVAGTMIFVLPANGAVPTVWLPLLRRPDAELVVVGGEPGGPFAPVLRLLADNADLRRRAVLNGVLQASELLRNFELETAAVLADPSRIRRPRDLAAACGVTLPAYTGADSSRRPAPCRARDHIDTMACVPASHVTRRYGAPLSANMNETPYLQ